MQAGGSRVLAPVKIVGVLLACLALATSAQGANTTKSFIDSDMISVRTNTGADPGGPWPDGYQVSIQLFSSTSRTKERPSPSNLPIPLTPLDYYADIQAYYWNGSRLFEGPQAVYYTTYYEPPNTIQYSLKPRSGSLSVASTAIPAAYRSTSSFPAQLTISAQIEWTCGSMSLTDRCDSTHTVSEWLFRSTSTGKFCEQPSVTGVMTVDGTEYKVELFAGLTKQTILQVYTP